MSNTVKGILPHWNPDVTFYNLQKKARINHRNKEIISYTVINRVTHGVVSDGLAGMVYYQNDIIILNK